MFIEMNLKFKIDSFILYIYLYLNHYTMDL